MNMNLQCLSERSLTACGEQDEDDDGDVYEYVDEEEYARRTTENAKSDFVVDDGTLA